MNVEQGYTATKIKFWWAGTVCGQGAVMKNPSVNAQKREGLKTDGRTDQTEIPTNKLTHVAFNKKRSPGGKGPLGDVLFISFNLILIDKRRKKRRKNPM